MGVFAMMESSEFEPRREILMSTASDLGSIRESVKQLCESYGEDYWLELDRTRGFPTAFVKELTDSGFLTVLIPEEYGGAGLGGDGSLGGDGAGVSFRCPCWRLSCPDVCDGFGTAAW